MALLSDLAADNPNIQQQRLEWRDMRRANGDATDDWEEFRQHLMRIGAPDPGEQRPEDFEAEA